MRVSCVATCVLAFGLFVSQPLKAAEAGNDVKLETQSISALKRMGAYLNSLKSFQIRAVTTVETVLDNDQKVQVQGLIHYLVRKPDHLRINFITDTMRRDLYYDGKDVTLVAPDDNAYARDKAPSDIKAMLQKIAAEYHLSFPMADLFDWGTPDAPVSAMREGFLVGKSVINGTLCDHWAYRMDDLDWEVWIQSEGPPLPLKYSIVDRSDPQFPRLDAVLEWATDHHFTDTDFKFVPPAGMSRIKFMPRDDVSGGP